MAASSMVHLNGNKLCVIDCETSGIVPGFHDLIQICVLPLNSMLEIDKAIMPFYMDIQPKRKENWDSKAAGVNRLDFLKICQNGMDPWKATDLFDEWFQKLRLAPGKRISPLAHNWPFDRDFLIDWLGGRENFFSYFDGRYRDTMTAALFVNDQADQHVDQIPYPKVNLAYLANILGVPHERAHDAMQDCVATAACYKKMMTFTNWRNI